jgi:hypothetical protein
VHGVFDKFLGLARAHESGALLAQAALVAAMLTIKFLVFLAASQLHFRRVHDDHMVAGVDERGIGRLVLSLE